MANRCKHLLTALLFGITALLLSGSNAYAQGPDPTLEAWGSDSHFLSETEIVHAIVGVNVKPTVNAKMWLNGVPIDPKWLLSMETVISQESTTYPGLMDDLLVRATVDTTKLLLNAGDILTIDFEGYSQSGAPQAATISTTISINLPENDCVEDCLCAFLNAIGAGKDPTTGAVTTTADACTIAAAGQALKDCLLNSCGQVNKSGRTFVAKDLDFDGTAGPGEGFTIEFQIRGDNGTSGLNASASTNTADISLAVGGNACTTCTNAGGNATAVNGKDGGASIAVGGRGGDHDQGIPGNPGNGGVAKACSIAGGGQGGLSIATAGGGGNSNGAGQANRGNGGKGHAKTSNQGGRAEGKGGDGGKAPNGTSAGGDGGDSVAEAGTSELASTGGKNCGAGKYGTGAYGTFNGGSPGGPGDGACEDL